MEKQDAAMDSRLPAFICATMSSRSVLLMLLINSIYLNNAPPGSVSTGDQALFTQQGSSIIFCFALRLLVVFIENIRNSIEARNGGLPHSSLTKRRIFEYKGTHFYSKTGNFSVKSDLNTCIFKSVFSNLKT